jgi:hypothetical protein
MEAQQLGLILAIAGALALGTPDVAAAATSGGVRITLTCAIGNGTTGLGTFKVTANGSSSVVNVPCGGSATITNPAWMAGATATIDQTAGPVGTKLVANRNVLLATSTVAFFTAALACSTVTAAPGCPAPTIGLTPRRMSIPLVVLLAVLIGSIALTILAAMLAPLWVIGQQIRYFHRLYIDQPEAYKEAMRHLALMPGMAWRIRLRSRLLRVPLPPGFDDAEQVIREDKQRL